MTDIVVIKKLIYIKMDLEKLGRIAKSTLVQIASYIFFLHWIIKATVYIKVLELVID